MQVPLLTISMAVDLEWLKIKSDSDLLLRVPGNHVTGITWGEVEGVWEGARKHTHSAYCRHNELWDNSPWFPLMVSRYSLISELNTRRSLSSRAPHGQQKWRKLSAHQRVKKELDFTLLACMLRDNSIHKCRNIMLHTKLQAIIHSKIKICSKPCLSLVEHKRR